MSARFLDEIAPRYIREKRIAVTVPSGAPAARAFQSFVLDVDYSRALPEGIALPLLLEIQGPSPQSYQRREFLRVAPQSIVFTPREGGMHLVTLREVAHNRWFGTIRIDVQGELLVPGILV